MGGVNKEEQKRQTQYNKYIKRPEKLKGARDAYVKRTGGTLKAVEQTGMYKDFSALEKRRYASLMTSDKKKVDEDRTRKSLLG